MKNASASDIIYGIYKQDRSSLRVTHNYVQYGELNLIKHRDLFASKYYDQLSQSTKPLKTSS